MRRRMPGRLEPGSLPPIEVPRDSEEEGNVRGIRNVSLRVVAKGELGVSSKIVEEAIELKEVVYRQEVVSVGNVRYIQY